jgi:hypothetical protein
MGHRHDGPSRAGWGRALSGGAGPGGRCMRLGGAGRGTAGVEQGQARWPASAAGQGEADDRCARPGRVRPW